MTLIQRLLHLTNFSSPFLRTAVPSIGAAFAIQTAFAIPSVAAQTERFYDFSGALTNISVVALSLYLPALRAAYAGGASAAAGAPAPLPSLLTPFTNPGAAALNWRQVALTAAVTVWAVRLGAYLFERVLRDGADARFDALRASPPRFAATWTAQATWCALVTLPAVALNAVPAAALPRGVRAADALGAALWAAGLALEAAADRQKRRWVREKRAKKHSEEFMTRGLWQRSRFPNYFGESMLWTGLATTSAGVLVTAPVQRAIGLSGGVGGIIAALSMAYVSPVFTTFLVTKVSGIPLSEKKYDKRYGDRKDYQEWKRNTPQFFPKIFS